MLFNSLEFLVFLPVVFVLYWFVFQRSLKLQNGLLLGASYLFYAGWDYRFLFLLLFSTMLDFFTALKMQTASSDYRRKQWFWLSVVVNVGFLGVFKYYNFFITSFSELLSKAGLEVHPWTLQVILPVGISFYTFHGLSYVIDVYKRRITAEENFVDYAVFVSYFPLLVAGPIERATHLLPQIKQERFFDSRQALEGVERILWGFFKKVVIADSMAMLVNPVYSDSGAYSGQALAVASLAFSFQIYGDFSGYSDIAIGVSKLFGIDLLRNFNFPYLARNIGEFWRRWHISLSSWFRDYVYYPLGGSRASFAQSIRNVFIIFLLSGFWHGANWTFIVWGAIHALLYVPSFLIKSNRKYLNDIIGPGAWIPAFSDTLRVALTFLLVSVAWIFFRSSSLNVAIDFLVNLATWVDGKNLGITNNDVIGYGVSFAVFFAMSAYLLYRQNGLIRVKTVGLYATSLLLLVVITLLGEFTEQSFIYFQF